MQAFSCRLMIAMSCVTGASRRGIASSSVAFHALIGDSQSSFSLDCNAARTDATRSPTMVADARSPSSQRRQWQATTG